MLLPPIVTFGRLVMGGEPTGRGMSAIPRRAAADTETFAWIVSIRLYPPVCAPPQPGWLPIAKLWLLMLVSKMPIASEVGRENNGLISTRVLRPLPST